MQDIYTILGVANEATDKEIKQAYKEMSKKLHPDKGGDPAKFQEMLQAYTILKDPAKRKRYDETGDMNEYSFDQVMKDLIQGVFITLALDNRSKNSDLIELLQNHMDNEIQVLEQRMAEQKERKINLEKVRKKVKLKAKQGENMFHTVIDLNLTSINKDIGLVESNIDSAKNVYDYLKHYEYVGADAGFLRGFTNGESFSSGTQ